MKLNVPKPPQKASAARAAYAGRLTGDVGMTVAPNNMKAESLAPLNFKVEPELHQRYKIAAATTGKSMREILEESFELWVDKNQSNR